MVLHTLPTQHTACTAHIRTTAHTTYTSSARIQISSLLPFVPATDRRMCCKQHSTAYPTSSWTMPLARAKLNDLVAEIWRCTPAPFGPLLLLGKSYRTGVELIQEPH